MSADQLRWHELATRFKIVAMSGAVAVAVTGCGSGGHVPVGSSELGAGEVPCLETQELDYPLEATFETPEEALAEALGDESVGAVADDLDEYHRIRSGEDLIEFQLRNGDQIHHRWAIRRTEDGGWATASFSGCVTADAAPPDLFRVGEEVVLRRVVTENTIDPCLLPTEDVICVEDGGNVLRLDVDDQTIGVFYGGHPGEPCRNEKATEQAAAAREGTKVEVFAEVEHVDAAGATVSVCGSEDFYVEKVS